MPRLPVHAPRSGIASMSPVGVTRLRAGVTVSPSHLSIAKARLPRGGWGTAPCRLSSKLGEVAERERGPEDFAAIPCEQGHQLVDRRHDGIGWGFRAGDGNAQADEDLFDPTGAGRHEHACALRADDVSVRDVPRSEEEVACGDVD